MVDDERIIFLRAKNTSTGHITEYNTKVRKAVTTYFDYAYYSCSKEEFQKIAYAKTLKFRVIGREGIEEYGTDRRLLDSFFKNLQQFYSSEIVKQP